MNHITISRRVFRTLSLAVLLSTSGLACAVDTGESDDLDELDMPEDVDAEPLATDKVVTRPGEKSDECWKFYVDAAKLCRIILQTGGGAHDYNECMNSAHEAYVACE